MLQTDELLTLNDSKGRSIRFSPLQPGEADYSRSENLWIVRGGCERLDDPAAQPSSAIARLNLAWMGLHEDDRRNPALFFVTNNPLGPWWVFGAAPLASDVTGKRLWLLGLNDRFSRSPKLQRNAEGHVTAVQDGAGRRYQLELKTLPGLANEGASGWGADSGVRLMAVHLTHDPHEPDLPTQPLVRYEYSARGELIAVHGRDGSQTRVFQYHPQLPGRMTAHAYTGRPPVRYVYNETGKVIEQLRQGALSYRFDYAEDSTTVTDSIGRVSVYHFEGEAGLKRVAKLQEADGSITQSRFDASGRLTASIDALGRETHYELDVATGALLSITQPDGLQNRFSYNPLGQIAQSIRPNGAVDHYDYDEQGRLVSATDALGHITRYHYADARSEQPHTIEDAKGGHKHLTWSDTGQLTSYTDCSGSITRYRHDRWGQTIGTEGEEATHASTLYDERGRVTSTTNALYQTTRYAYNEAGDLACITAPDGNSVQFERDAQGQPKVYHYGGLTQQFDYDEAGRMVRLTNENGAHTTFEYDVMDRLTNQVNFDGRPQQYQYNAAGELLQSDDAGRISHYTYDKNGRLLKRTIDNAEKGQTEFFTYDAFGQLTKAWHQTEIGGNTITAAFQRDLLGRVIRETQSIHGSDHSEIWSHSVDREFDALGSESQTTYSGLPAIDWLTYGSGHLHGVLLDGKSVIDFERDKLHRETSRQFGATHTSRTYDSLSRLKHLSTHSPLISEDQAMSRVHHYDPVGQLTRIDTPQGPHEYGYDKAGRLIAASQPGLENQRYRFDPAGNRLFENQNEITAKGNWEETVRQHLQDKQFNLLGKNTAKDAHDTASKWMDNRITDDGEFFYEYDAWGNLRRKYKTEGNEQHQYFYDSSHRMIRYEFESDTAVRGANYHYDPFGRRVVKQVQHGDEHGNLVGGTETTFFGWDGDRLVLTEKDNRQIHTIYEPGSFVPMIRVEGEKQPAKRTLAQKLQQERGIQLDSATEALFDGLEKELRLGRVSEFSKQWMATSGVEAQVFTDLLDPKPSIYGRMIHAYQCDHLGTPIALLDADSLTVQPTARNPWGYDSPDWLNESLHQPISFPGQFFDAESNLNYNRHRYYNTKAGNYISQDPIGFSGGIHWASYAKNNPISFTDPKGLEVYICTRPLGGLPGSYAPPLLNHTYVCVGSGKNMYCGSTTASSGGALSNIFGSSPGMPTTSATDYYTPDACEREWGEDSCIETCISNRLKNPERPRYGVGPSGTDCQEFTDDVVRICKKRCVRG